MRVPPYRQLVQNFNNEEKCIQYLQQKLILPKEINCLSCGQEMKLNTKMFKCNKRDCIYEITLEGPSPS